ncbi:TadE/TadG family type IV pilus assembly protein [Brevundimonas sp. PAMC22021]|uniref:TadE/TadG family type IV pilus assembly protein n=1 Tax=Brevundimonas sp. PAMC22021 TaxID=2861285 RepID=UPI001C628F29|nr:TadE/TadG family type IV pilus assembly protein [Brevundimonas sp. PAMC22021]QYF86115.1 pilus assembly protein [Brevundimonas sp. PAMC22021]
MEFALVSMPFFALLFMVLEIGLAFLINSTLETAISDSGRLIRTGRAEAQSFDAARFKQDVCGRMNIFSSDCDGRATIDVQTITRFDALPAEPAVVDGELQAQNCYNGGVPGDLVLVRIWYRQPMLAPFLNQGVLRLGATSVMLKASTAFRNEPWNPSGVAPVTTCVA